MKVSERKKKMRKSMLLKRATMSESMKAEYDERIREALQEIVKKNNYKTVHCCIPMGAEIDLKPLIRNLIKKGITVVAPKTLGNRQLKHLILDSLDHVEKGVFGTVYPSGDNEFFGDYDLIIVPGLAFDSENYRLGYGGGYYDNFLRKHPEAHKVGVSYAFQYVKSVPKEPHDIRLNEILVFIFNKINPKKAW